MLVAFLHFLAEKFYKLWNNVEDLEQEDDQMENIIGSRLYLFCFAATLVTLVILRTSFIEFLSPRLRFLIFQDWGANFLFIPFALYCYYKNPHLRTFLWKKVKKSSSVQPQENNEIELEME